MIKIKANFESDWIAKLRASLTQTWGKEIKRLDDREIAIYYFESMHRKIALQPRSIKISDNFSCPLDYESGWKYLQEKILKGKDINPHLSDKHSSIFNKDGMLSEWGIHHFHLGITPYTKNPSYVDRTKPLVFGLVDQATFYAIGVYKHIGWEDADIIENVHRNWPEAISRFRVSGVTAQSWDAKQRRNFRKLNCNVLTATQDGTVYRPTSGGIMASGLRSESVLSADHESLRLKAFQDGATEAIEKIMPILMQRGHFIGDEIEVHFLGKTELGYQVFLPKYDVVANVILESANV